MRLLIDENLSEALVRALSPQFPDSLHVRLLNRGGASDREVWVLARETGSVLLTRDEDFLQFSVVHGWPPKVILLRIGNCSTRSVVARFLARAEIVRDFLEHPEAGLLALG